MIKPVIPRQTRFSVKNSTCKYQFIVVLQVSEHALSDRLKAEKVETKILFV